MKLLLALSYSTKAYPHLLSVEKLYTPLHRAPLTAQDETALVVFATKQEQKGEAATVSYTLYYISSWEKERGSDKIGMHYQ